MPASWRLVDPLLVPYRSCPTAAAQESSPKCVKGSATSAKSLAWLYSCLVVRVTIRPSYPRFTHEGRAGGHAILSVRAGTRTVGRVLVDRRALPMGLLRLRRNERNLCRASRELSRVW